MILGLNSIIYAEPLASTTNSLCKTTSIHRHKKQMGIDVCYWQVGRVVNYSSRVEGTSMSVNFVIWTGGCMKFLSLPPTKYYRYDWLKYLCKTTGTYQFIMQNRWHPPTYKASGSRRPSLASGTCLNQRKVGVDVYEWQFPSDYFYI
jgi:hypothetical protein